MDFTSFYALLRQKTLHRCWCLVFVRLCSCTLGYGFRSFSSKSKFNYWMRVTRNLIEVQNFPSQAYVSSMKWVWYSLQSNFLRKFLRKTSNGFLINETPIHIAREKRIREKNRNPSSMCDTVGYHNGRFDNILTGMLNPW